jgi:hypothetical protein
MKGKNVFGKTRLTYVYVKKYYIDRYVTVRQKGRTS